MSDDGALGAWNRQAQEPETELAPNQGDLLQIALRRKGLLILGALVGVCLAYLQFARTAPTYQSTAQMLIQEKSSSLPTESVDTSLLRSGTASADHAFVLTSPFIVQKAVIARSLDRLPSLAESNNPVASIQLELQAAPLEWGSAVLGLSFRSSRPDDCEKILGAVMDTYRDFLKTNTANVGEQMVGLISEARDDLETKLNAMEEEYAKFQRQSPLFWQNGEATNIHERRQWQIEAFRAEILLKNSHLQAKIQAIESAIERGANRESLLLLTGQIGSDSAKASTALDVSAGAFASHALHAMSRQPGASLEERLFPILLQDALLAQKYGPDHPQRKSLGRQIEFAREFDKSLADSAVDQPAELLATYLAALREEQLSGLAEVAQLDQLFSAEQESAVKLSLYEAQDASFVNNIIRTQALFDVVVERLQEISLSEDYGGDKYTVQTLSPTSLGEKVAPSLSRMLFVGTVMGMLGGFGLGYLLERSDKSFHSPQEISSSLQLPLVGHIPEIVAGEEVAKDSALAPVLVASHRPMSAAAENVRAVRTAMYFSTHGQQHRVIQITSPVSGDGKSTLAANLAITIAQSGKRVLLLDADFRRPSQHKLFGLRMDVGLASVVDGQVEPPQAMQSTGIRNLSVMACGPQPHNPSELLTSTRFEELLNLLRDQFDFVLVDSPPLLAVTDPSVIAARVDGVLLTLRLRKNGRTLAIRARNILHDLDANVIGVVVNGIGSKKGSYGSYSDYRSAYGYGYQNGYGNTKTDRAMGKYYQHADRDEE